MSVIKLCAIHHISHMLLWIRAWGSLLFYLGPLLPPISALLVQRLKSAKTGCLRLAQRHISFKKKISKLNSFFGGGGGGFEYWGLESNWVHSPLRPPTGLVYLLMCLWGWRIWWNDDWQGETEVLGGNLPQYELNERKPGPPHSETSD
jgi:hypothetical protein